VIGDEEIDARRAPGRIVVDDEQAAVARRADIAFARRRLLPAELERGERVFRREMAASAMGDEFDRRLHA
jgi:hypothetical protein